METDQGISEEWDNEGADLSLKLTIAEIKAIPTFSTLTDQEADKMATSLYRYCCIVSQIIDNQYNIFDIGSKIEKKKSAVIQLNTPKNEAA